MCVCADWPAPVGVVRISTGGKPKFGFLRDLGAKIIFILKTDIKNDFLAVFTAFFVFVSANCTVVCA